MFIQTNRPHSVGKGWGMNILPFFFLSILRERERGRKKEREIVMILITNSHFPNQYQSCSINDVC